MYNLKENNVDDTVNIDDLVNVDDAIEVSCSHETKNCPVVVSEKVCLQADVSIKPNVSVGEIKTFCGKTTIGKCCKTICSHEPCHFSVSQEICVQIPLNFSAETKVEPAGHVCGIPETAPCHKC